MQTPRSICLVILLCALLPAYAGGGRQIHGYIRDTSGRGIPYCTVSILPAQDSTATGGTVSDTTGFYRLELPARSHCRIEYTHLACRPHSETIEPGADSVLDITLMPAAAEIGSVEVLARYTKHTAGKTTVSMIGNPLAENRTITEALNLLPGITVRNNEIKINGKPVQIVCIDDRIAGPSELQALHADRVDRIEIQDKTGSAYDATYSGGILRIRLRKQPDGSFYGTVNAGTTLSPWIGNYNGNIPFSLQYKKLNLYNYLSVSYNDETSDHLDDAEYRNDGYLLHARTRGKSHFYGLNETLSLVYSPGSRHTLGAYGGFAWSQSDPRYTQTSSLRAMEEFADPALPDAQYTDYRHGGSVYNRTYQAVISYKYALDTLGSAFTFKADYARRHVGKRYDYLTNEYRVASDETPFAAELLHEIYNPTTSAFQSRADGTKNFTAQRTLEGGLSYSYGSVDNNSILSEYSGGEWLKLEDQSVWFRNRIQNAAVYTGFSDTWGPFSYQLGLRFQWDRIAYKEAPEAAWAHRDYWRWFPEMSLAYTFNEQKDTHLNLDLSRYSGRIPSGSEILPKRVKTSDYSYTIGNPLLDPYDGFDLDLTYVLRGRWTFNYFFERIARLANEFSFYDPQDSRVICTMPLNTSKSCSHYLSAGVDTPVTKWLRISADLFGIIARTHYTLGSERYFYRHERAEFNCTLLFEPIRTLRITLFGSVRSKQQWSAEKWLNADYALMASVQKPFFKERLLATFTYAGIVYNDGVFTTEMTDGSYRSTSREAGSPRKWWGIRLSYRFNHRATRSIESVSTMQSLENVNN